MAVKIAHSSIDERGKATGGVAGDQTKKEVCTRNYYKASWDAVLRPKKAEIAEKSATFMEAACANDNIGYDQSQRNTLYEQAKKVSFDCSKIVVKCECDCSSLIHVAVVAAGANIKYGSNGFTTRTMVEVLEASGDYEVLTDSKYLTSDKYLKRGDILVNEGSHTVMVLTNGEAVASAKPTPKPSNSDCYPAYSGSSTSLDAILEAIGVPAEYRGNYKKRTPLAETQGIVNYTGSEEQNSQLKALARSGQLKRVVVSAYYPAYTGKETNLDAILKAIGVPAKYLYSYINRTPLAQVNGFATGYVGSYTQNRQLGTLAKQGKLKRV